MKVKFLKGGEVSEASIQEAFMEYVAHRRLKPYVMSIPNESANTKAFGIRLKRMGLRKGASDIFIAIPKRGFNGFFLELKSANGVLRPEQRQFFADMEKQGYFTYLARSLNSAILILDWYMEFKK